ncbi:D-glycero-beta-D-manno-heptose 1-phosphate adenylyltransferase [candidate division KSB1 bacterium]|nr:MAG: D-glycero-beta-D-manno-heptose 1-phosphate adenylyltransferase [candidate division KSB1 bacterium]
MHEIIAFNEVEQFIGNLRRTAGDVKIAFTNGCFDILHKGHVAYLEQAAETADYLVVGLNSDDSVRRLKGMDRPYVPQEDRAYILSRLEMVDIVCIFEQDTPLELIKRVKPDLLIKGGDYQLDEIVGREFVEGHGGKVLTIPLIQGRSTTNIIKKIKESN